MFGRSYEVGKPLVSVLLKVSIFSQYCTLPSTPTIISLVQNQIW